MKLNHYIASTAILAALAVPGLAVQQADEHGDLHLVLAAATPKTAPKAATQKPAPAAEQDVNMADMDAQMKRMREMHEKMMNAKGSKDRSALMAEHMKVMQDGMDMMGKMSLRGMGGMNMKMRVGTPATDRDCMSDGMPEQHRMIERRMEMMQQMMQMMMDRMSDASAK